MLDAGQAAGLLHDAFLKQLSQIKRIHAQPIDRLNVTNPMGLKHGSSFESSRHDQFWYHQGKESITVVCLREVTQSSEVIMVGMFDRRRFPGSAAPASHKSACALGLLFDFIALQRATIMCVRFLKVPRKNPGKHSLLFFLCWTAPVVVAEPVSFMLVD